MNKNKKGVVLEDIDSKLDLVLEGHKALDVKIDKNHEEFREFRKEVNYKLDLHSQMLTSHDQKLDSHTEMIGKLSVDIEIVKEDVEFIKNSLKKKVDVEEFAALERRVLLLEKRR